ncbi:GNAT family N-acetyltransferase [Elioraea rosea]|uniref:GNAT family N-acetyltransferase n=1 Tax=Elioraea rosea TaxID=2492390 RepID=UPI0011863CB0|nr:GNAT family N-acetyltransferase [Elioraea rosea]
MTASLDRPIWSALATRHAGLAQGSSCARRYLAEIAPFAATQADDRDCLLALGDLVRPAERVLVIQATPISVPPDLVATTTAMGVQMLLERPAQDLDGSGIERLGAADVEDMLALATLTKPGPFTLRALSLGAFWGIREQGRLIAMAGERFGHPGFTEISGVCTHPDAQGRGLAKRLSLLVARAIQHRGETPYLHAWETNARAITLYRSIGFRLRARMHVAAFERMA